MRYVWISLFSLISCALATAPLAAGEAVDARKWSEDVRPVVSPEEVDRPFRNVQAGVEVGRIEAVVAPEEGAVRISRVRADGSLENVVPQVEGVVQVGDQFTVLPGASVEMTFGDNVRLRVGPDSIVRIRGIVKRVGSDEEKIETTQRDVQLVEGKIRTRVKQNTLSPSPVVILSGNVTLLVNGSDALVRKARRPEGSDAKAPTVMQVLRGDARLILADRDSGTWTLDKPVPVGEGEMVEISTEDAENRPTPRRMNKKERLAAEREIEFAIDRHRARYAMPPRDRELDGP